MLLPTIILAYMKEGCSFANMNYAAKREAIFRNMLCSRTLHSIKMYQLKKKEKQNVAETGDRKSRRKGNFHHGMLCMSPNSVAIVSYILITSLKKPNVAS